jgi:bifunctional non-homologous end joining protein LigD
VTSLSALEQALSSRRTEQLIFIAFDLIHLDGYDLTRVPLIQRKQALRDLLGTVPENSPLQLSDYFIGRGAALFAGACRMGLEGIVCKRADANYRPGRSTTWLKVKSRLRGEFVIVGYTDSKAAGGLGALLLAERSRGALAFVGKVGTGFSGREAELLRTHLRAVHRDDPCLPVPKEFRRASANWTEPKLIAAVRYAARTVDGYLRHPVFEELIGLAARKPKE